MKKIVSVALLLLCAVSTYGQEITMQSLLREMVDRDAIAEFPSKVTYKTLQASSYNRASVAPDQPGWFADADGVSCIRTEKNSKGETEWVLMEDFGPGAITKIWAVCFYYGLQDTIGSNVRIYLDGSDEPTICCNFFEFVKGKDFVKSPLAATTRRAGNSYLPIPYQKGCKVTMDKKVFYNIINYRSYQEGTKVKSFTMEDYNNSRELVDSVNRVLAKGCTKPATLEKESVLPPGESRICGRMGSNGAVRTISIKLKADDLAQALRSTILTATFDDEFTVWSPVGDFFNIGVGMKSYRMWERSVEDDSTMVCRWVMPYKHKANIMLTNSGSEPVTAEMSVEFGDYNWTDQSMYFHSCWRMEEPTAGFPLFDYNLVKVDGAGLYVGDQFTVLNPAQGWWGEGDEKVYVDDDKFPSHFGTGTEDYYGWAGGIVPNPVDEFDEPFLANIRVAYPNSMGYNTCTRTRVLDAIPFQKHLDFNIESSGSKRNAWFHMQYAINTYWYAKPGAESNRGPLPQMASRKITTLEQLQAYNDSCKQTVYQFPGALEAENIQTFTTTAGVHPKEGMKVWGELSAGAVKAFTFDNTDDKVEVTLTELFKDTKIAVCLINGNESGEFDILINGKLIRTIDLASEHSAVALLDLGTVKPVDNAAHICFKCRRPGNLGIDYFTAD